MDAHAPQKTRLALAALLLSGCEAAPAPVLLRVEPSSGLRDRETPIALIGRNLDFTVEDRETGVVRLEWTGAVGPRALERIVWRSPERIEAVVPPGLVPGSYDVRLVSGTRVAQLPAAFTALLPVAPRIDSAEPAHLPPSGGEVRLKGIGLFREGEVRLRGNVVPVAHVDAQTLVLTAPPAEPGSATVRVTTPFGWAERDAIIFYDGPM